ncbi:MAG: hypothetical protein CSH49_14420 [Alcanivorax sp.]|nr:hypothetical protein [Ketobacter sp.]TNC87760.1 MAG: hypothetical protein CSH49_14420 [Alcanivorax sp.]
MKRFFSTALLAISLVLSGCGSESETIVDGVLESESLFFTADGRLFVSGGNGVYEIIQNGVGDYIKLDMFHENCLVEGIIQRYDYLYAVCSKLKPAEFADSYLLAARISERAPVPADIREDEVHPFMTLGVISPLAQLGIPNGMEVDEFGNIYIADSGKHDIVQVQFSDPTTVSLISLWAEDIAFAVNGLEWIGDQLYYTGIKTGTVNSVLGRIQRNTDGSAGAVDVLYQRSGTVLDDLAAYKDGVIVTDYLKGSLLFWKQGQVVAETPADTFFAPTAVAPAQPPMFDSRALVVTEKGLIFDDNPNWGNKVGLYYPDF